MISNLDLSYILSNIIIGGNQLPIISIQILKTRIKITRDLNGNTLMFRGYRNGPAITLPRKDVYGFSDHTASFRIKYLEVYLNRSLLCSYRQNLNVIRYNLSTLNASGGEVPVWTISKPKGRDFFTGLSGDITFDEPILGLLKMIDPEYLRIDYGW